MTFGTLHLWWGCQVVGKNKVCPDIREKLLDSPELGEFVWKTVGMKNEIGTESGHSCPTPTTKLTHNLKDQHQDVNL